ncbi:hypothetical protein [Campylobacter sp. VTCC 70190]|uniref:hypothetical protein n=1 Tax=Campylobacter sp. VTCC 70190 TaxID=3392118 RepID=UPI00398EA733
MQTQQVATKIQIERVKIPAELLEIKPLPKPFVSNEIEILNAYSMLFYHYKQCVINVEKIKDLQGNEK